jgi:hypothetical protein
MGYLVRCVTELAAAGSAACLPIPHTHTRQPQATLEITTADRRAIPGALLHVYGGIIVGQGVRDSATYSANALGVVDLPYRSEWHWVAMLLPDGEASWVWAWCAEAPGYNRTVGRMQSRPAAAIHVQLTAGAPLKACPQHPANLDDVAPRYCPSRSTGRRRRSARA